MTDMERTAYQGEIAYLQRQVERYKAAYKRLLEMHLELKRKRKDHNGNN